VRADDIPRDPRYGRVAPHFGASQGSLPVRSYLAVPVRSGTGEAMGGLFFGHAQPGVLTERAERLVRGMAAQAAAALAHARSYQHERRARAEAERASALKDEFLATVSHELRAPLSAIVGWARVIASRPMEAEELARIAGIIDDNAGAQARLIEDLLDVSRIASGTLRLDALSIQPARVIEAAVEALRPVAAQKDIRIAVLLDADAGPVRAEPGRVQQVVWNLVSNALEFTPRGGRIQVVLRRAGSHAEIAVADTGIGIEAQFLPHVFDRFGRADDTFRHHPGGLGLGLSIARHLVELHGGTIRAESAGKGCGATFTVCLPLTAAEHPALDAR
jgi:signal transduction histidine kinase